MPIVHAFYQLYTAADRTVPRELRGYNRFRFGMIYKTRDLIISADTWALDDEGDTLDTVDALVDGRLAIEDWRAVNMPERESVLTLLRTLVTELSLLDHVARFLDPPSVADIATWKGRITPVFLAVRAKVDALRAARAAVFDGTTSQFDLLLALDKFIDEADDLVMPLYHGRTYGMEDPDVHDDHDGTFELEAEKLRMTFGWGLMDDGESMVPIQRALDEGHAGALLALNDLDIEAVHHTLTIVRAQFQRILECLEPVSTDTVRVSELRGRVEQVMARITPLIDAVHSRVAAIREEEAKRRSDIAKRKAAAKKPKQKK